MKKRWMVWIAYRRQIRILGLAIVIVMGLMCWFLGGSVGQAQASERGCRGQIDQAVNAHDTSVQVGPYQVEVQFSSDPPHVEEPLNVTLHVLGQGRFSGQLTGQPGLGTDAVPVHAQLGIDQGNGTILSGELHLSVRGSWHIVIDLDGPRGPGTATMDVTVSAPNAIPTWLGWLMGLSPLVGCAWLVYQQAGYRRRLLRGVGHQEGKA